MGLIDRVFSFYVFSNIHVSLSSACLLLLTLEPYGVQDNRSVTFVFCGTVLAYNFIRALQLDRIHPALNSWIRSHMRPLLILNSLALIGLVLATFEYSGFELLFVTPFFILTVFYVIPFSGRFKGLRNLPGLKLFLIAAVWAGVTVLFPLWVNDLPLDRKCWLVFAQRFLFIFAITIPFDLRDLQLDREDLATLPQMIGINNSKLAAWIALALFTALFFFGENYSAREIWIGSFIALLSGLLVSKAGVYQGRFYSSFWVESLPIFWLLITVSFT